MVILLTILHVVVSFFLIIVVLLQSGKAADLAGAFGGMGSQTAFGPKATTTAAVLFMLTSITLGIMQGRRIVGQSVIDRSGIALEEEAEPATPDVPAPAAPVSAPSEAEGETQE